MMSELCPCGYFSHDVSHVYRHRKTCKVFPIAQELHRITSENEIIKRENEMLKNTDRMFEMCNLQLAQKDEIIAQKETTIVQKETTIAQKETTIAQKDTKLAEKDAEIKRLNSMLIKRAPQTINNTNYITVVFGRESTEHITDSMVKQILRLPLSSIPKYIHLKHFSPEAPPHNRNVLLPNVRGNTVQVCREGSDGPEFMHEDRSNFVRNWVENNKEELRGRAEDLHHTGWMDTISRFGDAEMKYCITSAESILKNNRKRKAQ